MRSFQIKKMALFLTELCDQQCEFCDIPSLNNPNDVNFDLLKKYLNIIDKSKSFIHYTITGGEPGLVNRDIWDFIFNTLVCHPIRINTNGLFIEKGYWDLYRDKLWQIGIHINLGDEIQNPIIDEKVWYYLPIYKKNAYLLEDMIKKYPDLQFSVIPYLHKDINLDINEFDLDINEYIKILDTISSYNNVASCSKDMIQLINNNTTKIELFRRACQYNYIQPLLDFVNGRIGRCVFSYTQNNYVEMNKINLEKLFNGTLDFGKKDTACDVCMECFRYFDFYFNNTMVKVTS